MAKEKFSESFGPGFYRDAYGLLSNRETNEITVFGRRNKDGAHTSSSPWQRDVLGIHTLSTPIYGEQNTDAITLPSPVEVASALHLSGLWWCLHGLTNSLSFGRGGQLVAPEASLYLVRSTAIEQIRSVEAFGELPVRAVISPELFEQATVVDLSTFRQQASA